MNDTSPHSPIDDHSSESPTPLNSKLLRFFIGMTIGGSLPLLLAGYFISQFSAYTATLPPDSAICGTPLLLPFVLIVFVTPIMGLVTGGVALLIPIK
ncbi:hypothetical protein [Gimesia aquarii]|uniref:Uncharacterized protein n=1 Tax=Gimesia aquarii TaxID=2527964 RepID=A0A517WU29_9PLAN|nr:hypothetical protein [Gimesia aquarii]QDU08761.1 hypothetical protein V202x_21310 [Gimesia aquarii]